jgi:hypothetical protein
MFAKEARGMGFAKSMGGGGVRKRKNKKFGSLTSLVGKTRLGSSKVFFY